MRSRRPSWVGRSFAEVRHMVVGEKGRTREPETKITIADGSGGTSGCRIGGAGCRKHIRARMGVKPTGGKDDEGTPLPPKRLESELDT